MMVWQCLGGGGRTCVHIAARMEGFTEHPGCLPVDLLLIQ
jgi:hypothetical protein